MRLGFHLGGLAVVLVILTVRRTVGGIAVGLLLNFGAAGVGWFSPQNLF